ncbi:hypothetical protein DFH09DRAFT_1078728 [Mycena vulgaris]|nr:hypothetical protein DFH09DRAFT_1078728 [Mycena vulgaris]
MFNHAELSLILMEHKQMIWPDLVRDMKAATDVTDHLGLTGCSLFACNNYTSPIHRDQDKTIKSICSQLLLQAKYGEYAFVRLRYRVVVLPRSNTLWSFDEEKEHCCFLPSTEPLTSEDLLPGQPAYRLRGGAAQRVSIGYHETAPTTSIEEAENYQAARETLQALEAYWEGDVE